MNSESCKHDQGAFRVGVLGSPSSWYMRDLRRAAEELSAERPTVIDSLAFSRLSVQSTVGDMPIASSWTQSDEPGFQAQQVSLADFDSVLVRTMPLGSVEQIVFRMNALHAASASGVQVLNSPRTLEIAIDKWLTLDVARRHAIATPRTICCQTRDDALAAWDALGQDCIVKPIFGGEGRGIVRVTERDMAWRVFSTLEQLQSVIYVQEFLESVGYDLRLLVLGDELFCVRRENRGNWKSNVSQGGFATPHEPTFEQIAIAFKASQAIGGWMVGVDVLPTRDGRDMLLEVNAVPGWRATASALQVDMAQVVLRRLHALA